MTSASTEIATAKASYYLQMLCKHWSHRLQVEFTPERGVIRFPPGAVCTLEAEGGAEARVLKATVEAADAEAVAQFENVVINHLKRFAHSEDLGDPVWR